MQGHLAQTPRIRHCMTYGISACCADQPFVAAEVLQYTGTTKFSEPRWWNVGYAKLQGEDLNYLGVSGLRIAGSQGVLIIAVCQVCCPCGNEGRTTASAVLDLALNGVVNNRVEQLPLQQAAMADFAWMPMLAGATDVWA